MQVNRDFDIAVIGAGPAGTHLATRLAKAGQRVALFDPKVPWEKPCGGGITHKAWSRFPFLTDPTLPRNEVSRSLQISSNGRFFVIDQGHPLFIVSRYDLSRMMLQNAVDAGAVHFPLAAIRLDTWGPQMRIKAGRDVFQARTVVGADGVHSLVRNYFLGPLPAYRTLSALVQFFEKGPDDPTMIQVAPFPGYAWSFARQDCLCVGVGAMEHGHALKPTLDQFMRRFFPGRKPIGAIHGAPLPYLAGPDAYTEPRVGPGWALVGDAAGFCDTLTGEGILYAIWSADLLADAILRNCPGEYETAWRKAFGGHLRAGAWAATRLYSPRNIDFLFTAITVCPTFQKQIMDFIWDLPPYHQLARRLLRHGWQIHREWRRFRRNGGQVDLQALGPFQGLADQLTFRWNKA